MSFCGKALLVYFIYVLVLGTLQKQPQTFLKLYFPPIILHIGPCIRFIIMIRSFS
jgi:hypothetical protein